MQGGAFRLADVVASGSGVECAWQSTNRCVESPAPPPYLALNRRNSNEFMTTLTLDIAIAAAAIIGSRNP